MSAHQVLSQLAQADHTIADPGDAGTITVLRNGTCKIVSAGSETRTIAAPTQADLEISVVGKTIPSGTVTVTVTGGYSEVGDTTFTITAAGQFITLRSFEVAAATFAWRRTAGDAVGSSAATTAAEVSILDTGTYTSATNVEEALADIYASLVTTEVLDVPLTSVTLEDGTALTKQATTAIGFVQLDNKQLVIDFPASAATAHLAFTVNLPAHARKDTNVRLKVLVSKSSNTDTLTMDAELYFLDSVTMAWSADGGGAAVSIPSATASWLTFTVANPSTLTDNPHALAVVLQLVEAHTTDAVYIHAIYVQYTGAVV